MTDAPLAKRGLNAHSVVGLVISTVLYIICLSGTVSVFKDELQLLEHKGEPVVDYLSPQSAPTAAENGMREDPESKHLFIHMPVEINHRAIVQTDNKELYVDAGGNVSAPVNFPWTDFIIDLHYYLNLPRTFGMQIVAIFGVFLFAMSVTGFVAHPKIFKDAFSFRRNKSEQIKKVDLHNRLSVWTAPFHISNSLTGAMIGLASLSALTIGALKYDGDFEAVFEPVFGGEPAADLAPAPIARIDKALAYMEENHPDLPPLFVILHDPGTKGQYLQIMAEHPNRLIYAEKYNFSGEGDFIDTVGSADGTTGQQVADSVYRIHFGNFGGYPVKIAFVIFGLCLLIIITSGMNIYFLKQQARGRNMSHHRAVWQGVVAGAPAMLVLTFIAAYWQTQTSLAAIFWLGLLGCVALTLVLSFRPDQSFSKERVAD